MTKAPSKSPLRYPGGKSRAVGRILELVPDFSEFREPLVGGGSVFLALRQKFPGARFWINDINQDLYSFWKSAKEVNRELCERILEIRRESRDGKNLFRKLAAEPGETFKGLERAARFFILNRITFSGTTESGGYSEAAFRGRFTESSIRRIGALEPLLEGVRITNRDYSELLSAPGEKVFIFLDPPYLSRTKSRLYGKSGDLHTSFDHGKFSRAVRACKHRWLITYDNSTEVRAIFPFARLKEWTLQYGMNNFRRGSAPAGKELFLANYPF